MGCQDELERTRKEAVVAYSETQFKLKRLQIHEPKHAMRPTTVTVLYSNIYFLYQNHSNTSGRRRRDQYLSQTQIRLSPLTQAGA
jgi:hypothetical protein